MKYSQSSQPLSSKVGACRGLLNVGPIRPVIVSAEVLLSNTELFIYVKGNTEKYLF